VKNVSRDETKQFAEKLLNLRKLVPQLSYFSKERMEVVVKYNVKKKLELSSEILH